MNLVMRSAASTNLQIRKLLNHDVVAANTFAAATQIPPPTQASLLPVPMISTVAFPSGLSQSGSNQSGLSESGSNQSGLSKSGSSKSGSESGSEIAAFATGQGSTDGSLTPPVLSSEAAAGDSGFFEIARGSQNNSSQNGPVLEEPFELAENTPRSSLDSTAHQSFQLRSCSSLRAICRMGCRAMSWDWIRQMRHPRQIQWLMVRGPVQLCPVQLCPVQLCLVQLSPLQF